MMFRRVGHQGRSRPVFDGAMRARRGLNVAHDLSRVCPRVALAATPRSRQRSRVGKIAHARATSHLHGRRFCPPYMLALALAFSSTPALAQTSQKPIQIIVPFAPGASADGAARIVANELGARLGGRLVVVENKAGGGGTIGLQAVAKAAPDGDTLGVGATGALLLNPNLPVNPGPDLLRDLAPVAKIIDVAVVLVANAQTGPKSIQEMIARSKATPNGLTYGSTGANTSQHITIELLKKATGANLVHVPYRGSAPALTDLIAGQVHVMFDNIPTCAEHVKSGKLRGLAVTSTTRSAVLPDLPTVADFLPGYEASAWYGIVAPKNTPAEVIDRLNTETNAVLANPTAKTRFAELGAFLLPGSAADFGSLLAEETEKWGKVVKFAGARVD
jgi:tripartite-type tricarboxylate transporter receptor subunit TctC